VATLELNNEDVLRHCKNSNANLPNHAPQNRLEHRAYLYTGHHGSAHIKHCTAAHIALQNKLTLAGGALCGHILGERALQRAAKAKHRGAHPDLREGLEAKDALVRRQPNAVRELRTACSVRCGRLLGSCRTNNANG